MKPDNQIVASYEYCASWHISDPLERHKHKMQRQAELRSSAKDAHKRRNIARVQIPILLV